MSGLRSAHYIAGLAALSLVFVAVIPAVTSINLDQGDCYLNLIPGRVCDFAYVTSGLCGFFTVLLGAGVFATLRQPANSAAGFVPAIFGSLSLFTAFWWLVAAITFTKRAQQASDAGLPEGAARNAVVGLSWIEAVLSFFSFVLVVYDRVLYRRFRIHQDKTHSLLDLEQQAAFKQQYVATQVLGSTPVA